MFLEPDKRKAVVVMEKEDYKKAALEHLNSDNYELVKTKRRFPVDYL